MTTHENRWPNVTKCRGQGLGRGAARWPQPAFDAWSTEHRRWQASTAAAATNLSRPRNARAMRSRAASASTICSLDGVAPRQVLLCSKHWLEDAEGSQNSESLRARSECYGKTTCSVYVCQTAPGEGVHVRLGRRIPLARTLPRMASIRLRYTRMPAMRPTHVAIIYGVAWRPITPSVYEDGSYVAKSTFQSASSFRHPQ